MEDLKNKSPQLLIDKECVDTEELLTAIKENPFVSLDENVPVCRFRGTLIKKSEIGYEIIAWERNISRLQKMDVSLSAIIKLEVTSEFEIKEIALDKDFSGSKGLLCYQPYLDNILKENLIDKKIDGKLVKELAVEKLHCFHLSEIMCALVSDIELLTEHQLSYLYEEEVMDGFVSGQDMIMRGKQKLSFSEKVVDYTLYLENIFDKVGFSEDGGIYFRDSVKATFYKDGEALFTSIIKGEDKKKSYVTIGAFVSKGLRYIKKDYTKNSLNSFMCSILAPAGFIGGFIQSISMKMFSNNYNHVLHCLTGLQRFNDVPRCIGAVDSQEEADTNFAGYSILEVMC